MRRIFWEKNLYRTHLSSGMAETDPKTFVRLLAINEPKLWKIASTFDYFAIYWYPIAF